MTMISSFRPPVVRSFFLSSLVKTSCRWSSILSDILKNVKDGKMEVAEAQRLLQDKAGYGTTPSATLASFANLDHDRSKRTGFPEVVFGAGKTPHQVATILDEMAKNVNLRLSKRQDELPPAANLAILATRVTSDEYEQLSKMSFVHGKIHYHPTACVVSMIPSGLNAQAISQVEKKKSIIVVTAGTTDLPVAEEAAVVLEAANCRVGRVYDVGVAGLHRIISALPILCDSDVGCVIVCAGMDGALPSVVGGLVSVPVVAVPTSVGYGAAFGGISAMLTMLNSCAPGVAVVNIDNGFGAAAFAFKCLNQ